MYNEENHREEIRRSKLNWPEARSLYVEGKITDLYVDAESIDLSKVTKADFANKKTLTISLYGKHYSSPNDALVYGKLDLVLDDDGYVTILDNQYDFDYKEKGSFFRNYGTSIAGFLHGEFNAYIFFNGYSPQLQISGYSQPGSGYLIHFEGKVKISD